MMAGELLERLPGLPPAPIFGPSEQPVSQISKPQIEIVILILVSFILKIKIRKLEI